MKLPRLAQAKRPEQVLGASADAVVARFERTDVPVNYASCPQAAPPRSGVSHPPPAAHSAAIHAIFTRSDTAAYDPSSTLKRLSTGTPFGERHFTPT